MSIPAFSICFLITIMCLIAFFTKDRREDIYTNYVAACQGFVMSCVFSLPMIDIGQKILTPRQAQLAKWILSAVIVASTLYFAVRFVMLVWYWISEATKDQISVDPD